MQEIQARIQGRHEGSTCRQVRIKRATLEASAGPLPGEVILRVEDEDNPAFWLDILLTDEQLEELQKINPRPWKVGALK